MPLTGAIPEGRSFFCPHCGALYSVKHSRLSKSEDGIAKCVVCHTTMDKWDNSTTIPDLQACPPTRRCLRVPASRAKRRNAPNIYRSTGSSAPTHNGV